MGRNIHIYPTTTVYICRCLRGLSQTEVGAALGISQGGVSQVERKSVRVGADLQKRFADFYKKPVADLFSDDGFAKIRASQD